MGTQSSHKLERHWEEMAAEARGWGCAQQRGGQNLGLHVLHDTTVYLALLDPGK